MQHSLFGPLIAHPTHMELSLFSPAFDDGQEIPVNFTDEAEDISPPLEWSNVPDGTREFAMICEDPDAPQSEPFVHWVVYNISPTTTQLPEGLLPVERLDAPIRADQGINSFGKLGYNGPMPPRGHGVHRYLFKIYALDTELGLAPGASKSALLKAMEGHLLNEGLLIGVFERKAHSSQDEPRKRVIAA